MTTGHHRRSSNAPSRRTDRENNLFLVMISFSLFVHILAVVIFQHKPMSNKHRPPTVYIDLVMAPVSNPQRGSASAGKKVVAPVAAKTEPALPVKVEKNAVVLKAKEAQKKAPVENIADINKDIDKYRKRRKEQEDLDNAEAAIAAMKKKTTATKPETAAVGSASGTGDEAGSAIADWLRIEVKRNWTWPDRKRKNLSAAIDVEFDSNGKLISYRMRRSSGDARFDKSLNDALLKLEGLPKPLRKPFNETIVFNLDDLQRQ